MSFPIEPTVPGLTTPQLNGGEITAEAKTASTVETKTEQKVSVMDIALSLENSLKEALDMVDKNDKEVNDKLELLNKRLLSIESELRLT
ncbi:uncharacterized protein CANTADRAFT_77961 [Suhomyces tanzawaensis NRRL Y-17324]|uniref:Uncharacterized protein n=1 Tax=Suhomyces tanzawaensis NRRL Y-17324 TaxID=984487 RepID=A0A1E4SJB4_9ASCO|nr:uncharacterized protein CANTADRAFT_77961 [Suhomyces tanzawaensis NRRL Y-17324]ODV79605.1 hypothetical protein CANTADRAFT_77961 [Suhomyces tanzawaensis NRRL Y-17324]